MAKLTLTDVTSSYAAITVLNANWAAIETALENTLSRDGTAPNGMADDIDMDSNFLLNLPQGTTAGHAIEYSQFKLANLTDLNLTGLADGNTIVWDATGMEWIPGTGGGGGGGGGGGTVTSVAVSGSDGIQVDSGSPVTAAGTIALGVDKTTLLTHINVADGATANSADGTLLARANHTGTQNASTISDFSSAADARIAAASVTDLSDVTGTGSGIIISAAERTKLSGIATGATANSSDATLLARANHTGTQLSTTISDFTEAAQDAAGAMVDSTLVYVDGTPLLTRAALTGDVTAPQASNVTTIANNAVTTAKVNDAAITLAKMANLAEDRIIGRANGAGTGVPTALTPTQISTMLQNNSVIRKVATANTTFYVRSDGNDSNNGLTDNSGGAKLTWQAAWSEALTYDFRGFTCTLKCSQTGLTFNNGLTITSPLVGASSVIIEGDTTSATVTLNASKPISLEAQIPITLRGFKITSGANGVFVRGGTINMGIMEFGACTSSHMRLESGGTILPTVNYSITGNSPFHHILSGAGAFLRYDGLTVTLPGTPAFTIFAYVAGPSQLNVPSNTYSGSATGIRYFAELNGVINTAGGGPSYIPGNSAGSTGSGGQYV